MQMQTPMQIQNKSEQHPLDATFASCAQQMQMQMQHQQMVQQKQQQQQQQFLQFQQQLQLLQSHASPQSPAPCPAPTPTPQAPPSQPTQTAASNDLGILPPSSVATRAASAAAQLPLDPQLQQLLQQLDAHALQQLLSTSQEVLFQSTGSQTSSQHQQLQLLQQLQQHLVIQQQQAILQQQQKNEQPSENHSQALSKGLPLNHAAQHEQIQKNLLMLHQQQSQQLQQLQQQQQQLQQKQLFQRQQQLQQMYQQTAHQIVSQPSPQQSQTVQPVPPPQASPPSLQSPQVSQTFQHQSMPQNAPQQTQQTTPQPQTPPPQQSPQQTIYQSQQLPQQTVSLPFGSMSFNKQNTQQTSAYAPQLCSSPQQQMQTAQSTTATHTGTLQLQCNDLPTILKLCEAVGQYVSDSNQHKIDWNHISRSMPWSPSECQAVWRHIAYSWKPEDVTGSTLNTTELDGNESDEEQLLKSMHPKVLQPSPQIQPQMDTSYTKILQPTGNYLPKQEAEEPPTKKGRKRKVWKPEDDVALLDAVELYGESNWPYLAQQLSHLERSHSQLSSRYTALRKKAQKGNCGDARIKWKLDCIAKKSEKQS
ncbi:hypothetical protein Pelo_8844 [Pelomyxa schiedti]|nr:hypothetical protein Pelo_8844 [Pelomyxa schiedti]